MTRGAAWHGESLVKVRVQAVTRGAARRTFQASDRTSGRSRTDLTPACIFFLPLVMERAGFRHLLTLDAAADARPVLLRRKLLLGFLEVPLRPAHAPASADECQIRRRPPQPRAPLGAPSAPSPATRSPTLASHRSPLDLTFAMPIPGGLFARKAGMCEPEGARPGLGSTPSAVAH